MSLPLSRPVGGERSVPASLFASASWYQWFGNSKFAPFNSTNRGPDEPRTADVAVHASGLNAAWIVIGTGDVRRPPQMFAACWKTFRRCCPIVVPGLPPTGTTIGQQRQDDHGGEAFH